MFISLRGSQSKGPMCFFYTTLLWGALKRKKNAGIVGISLLLSLTHLPFHLDSLIIQQKRKRKVKIVSGIFVCLLCWGKKIQFFFLFHIYVDFSFDVEINACVELTSVCLFNNRLFKKNFLLRDFSLATSDLQLVLRRS